MRSKFRRRRGTMFFEATMAMVIASAVLVGVTQILALTSQQRRAAEYRALATYEAGNVMEDLMTRSWPQLTNASLRDEPLSAVCRQRLPGGRLRVDITPDAESDAVRRLSVQVDWEVATNQRCQPVRLVAWRYQPQEPAP